jgi:glycosyltransferase involved in cell wall biosynthesis
MNDASATHLVLIPSYNSGRLLEATVQAARHAWSPVWVVVDGSTDGSEDAIVERAKTDPHLRVIRLPRNRGKGGAVLHGLTLALELGYTHVLTMDADGQHSPDYIAPFMDASFAEPSSLIFGQPIFAADAPKLRVYWRRLSNGLAQLETLHATNADSLFGFRLYPARALYEVMQQGRFMRRFDFDPEVAVRLLWRGLPCRTIPTPVRYLTRREGGISHFNYLRDNLLLGFMHARLLAGFVVRLPSMLARRRVALGQGAD